MCAGVALGPNTEIVIIKQYLGSTEGGTGDNQFSRHSRELLSRLSGPRGLPGRGSGARSSTEYVLHTNRGSRVSQKCLQGPKRRGPVLAFCILIVADISITNPLGCYHLQTPSHVSTALG